ncbi:DUF4138 domain-containing protein [Algibacter miyuki]|uniref:DUF4138 domain-containing protein n=1 Tax=Algibacter miyuki TaxID=1306933 RepID=A0ABV5H0V3_9FLAO|nr:DUF4138 domain-containing protein [Algibacter miyuki]MDN3664071.1 DUF4138 domain-containing protein [Algibacter miyuki]
MKKIILVISLILFFTTVKAQQQINLDTIYANNNKNVALFFPNPIRQGITGSDNFVFTYNRDQEQYFGLLQAIPGNDSNLLIINNNGAIFSYIVKYKETLNKLNYFIPDSASIGNETPMNKANENNGNSFDSFDYKINYYERFCSYLINRRQRIGKLKKRKDAIVLKIENIVFDKAELYFVITIENKSSLDYDVNFLNLSIQTRKKGKKKSLQELCLEPIFKYNVPSKIKEKQTIKFVYVVSKFSISDERLVLLDLNEDNGERNIKLKIADKTINNPN